MRLKLRDPKSEQLIDKFPNFADLSETKENLSSLIN